MRSKRFTSIVLQYEQYNTFFIDNSPQGVFQWQFTILKEIKST